MSAAFQHLRAVALAGLVLLAQTLGGLAAEGAPGIGIGLAPVRDWSTEQPFLDVMKTARRWIGHKPGQWGGVRFDELEARGILDAEGWPKTIPGDLSAIGTLVLTDLPAEASAYAGRYRLRFEGDGIVEVSGRAQNVRYGAGEVRFDFTPGEGGVEIRINRTDRQGSGDYLRHISVVREDQAALYDAGAVFNPLWRDGLDGFAVLRFMDWMVTNDSSQSAWTDRPRVDDFSYTRQGVPLEVMLALANDLGAAPWFNMPHLADDGYIRHFAEAVHAGLAADLKVYVEFSNEVWNWQFTQADWAGELAQARWGDRNRWMQAYGLRAAESAGIWAGVFPGADRARLVNVISTQTGWLGLEAEALQAPLFVAENPAANRPPAEAFDAYAVAGYFGYALGTDKRAAQVRGWIAESRAAAEVRAQAAGLSGAAFDDDVTAHQYDAAIATAARELADGSVSGEPQDSVAALVGETLAYHRDVATRYGLDLVAYEGGTHLVGIGAQVDDDALTGFFTELNYAPEMAGLYRALLDGWAGLGGGVFVAYLDVMAPGKWGSWGNLRFLGDETPRWDVLRDVVEAGAQ